MKKSHKEAWIVGALVVAAAGGGIWWYEKNYAGATATLAPGAMSVATPSNGSASLALPSGAKAWQSATTNVSSTTVPSSPTTHLVVSVGKGTVVTVTWTDSTGATQTSVVTFT